MKQAMQSLLKSSSYEKLDLEEQDNASNSDASTLIASETKPPSFFKSLFFILSTFLSALILILSVLFHLRWQYNIPTYPIDLPPTTYRFTSDTSLRPFDKETMEKWEASIPDGWSGVQFQDPQGEKVVAGIDMYHRLHCLNSIRGEFTKLVTEPRHWYTFYNPETEASRLHLGHCFDYIRQDILCAADATLEPLDEELRAKEGNGVEHQCRDHSMLERLVRKWRVD